MGVIKTYNGLAAASVKTVNGLAIASVKTWNGLDATSSAYDADAQAWFDAVVAAGSSITTDNKAAVSAFVAGCKTDGVWTAIKASCLLCAADDLTGALVPLVGAAPTNNGPFVAGDYSRTAGLIGDGSAKFIDSNRNNNADPQDNQHMSVYVTAADSRTSNYYLIGAGGADTGATHIQNISGTSQNARSQSSTRQSLRTVNTTTQTGFMGISRVASTGYSWRFTGASGTGASTSQTPRNEDVSVFGIFGGRTQARLSFYSIGEALDGVNGTLALLDARLITLMAALT